MFISSSCKNNFSADYLELNDLNLRLNIESKCS